MFGFDLNIPPTLGTPIQKHSKKACKDAPLLRSSPLPSIPQPLAPTFGFPRKYIEEATPTNELDGLTQREIRADYRATIRGQPRIEYHLHTGEGEEGSDNDPTFLAISTGDERLEDMRRLPRDQYDRYNAQGKLLKPSK